MVSRKWKEKIAIAPTTTSRQVGVVMILQAGLVMIRQVGLVMIRQVGLVIRQLE